MPASNDFEELLAVLDLNRISDELFIGSHPSKNPMRTFGGQLMAQSFVASSRTLIREDLPPSALSVHFINGGVVAILIYGKDTTARPGRHVVQEIEIREAKRHRFLDHDVFPMLLHHVDCVAGVHAARRHDRDDIHLFCDKHLVIIRVPPHTKRVAVHLRARRVQIAHGRNGRSG